METLLWILAATVVNSLIALIGVFSLWMKPETLEKVLMLFVAFAAGSLLGGALLHLMAESVENMGFEASAVLLIVGFSIFFVLERFLKWHHCHEVPGEHCETHPVSYLILFGDGLHNFIDGLVIAASFVVSIPFGVITTIVIMGHEIPQELGNFGVLVYGGFEKKKALLYNFVAQLTCVLGGLVGYFLALSEVSVGFLLPIAAGGFIYIATSDLIPELHKEPDIKKSVLAFIVFFLGLAFIAAFKSLAGE